MAIKKLVVGIVVLVLIGIVLFFSASGFTGKVISNESSMASFVDCLNEKNFTLYGHRDDFNVKGQLSLFGAQSSSVNFVDCAQFPEKCERMFIFPVWKAFGQQYQGALSLGVLSTLSGCAFN